MCALANCGRQKSNIRGGSQALSGNGKSAANPALLAAALDALTHSVAIIDARGLIVAVNDTWRRYAEENGMRWPRHGVGYNYLSVLDSAAATGDENLAQIALGIRRVLAGSANSFRAEYDCHTLAGCYFLQHVTAFDFDGVRHAIVVHENITLRKLNENELRAAKETAEAGRRDEQTRRESAEHRRWIAEAVADMQLIANSGLQLEDALLGMVERVHETVGSQAAAIYCAEERWDRLTLTAASSTLRDSTRTLKSPIPSSILAKALADRRGVCVNDAWKSPAVETDEWAPEGQRDYRALLATSIHCKEKLFGYLVLFYTEAHEFCEDDLELGRLFGQQVTLVLENAELRSHAEKAALENERNRLARELHDAVTQTLFSASVVAEALPRVWERDPAEGRRALEDLRLWTRGALAELRSLLMELRPAALIEKPLPDLIRQLSEAAGTRLGIPVFCHLTSEAEPPAEVKLCLYRVTQEALNNTAKHSCASQVEIQYRALPQTVELTVIDNGKGFDVDRRTPGQMGLMIMRERTRHVSAKLTVRSAPGAGTEVRVEWRPREKKDFHE